MIATKYKSDLPQGFSYPIGAQALSQALADVPQIAELTVSFHFHHCTFRTDLNRTLTQREPYIIMSASFCWQEPNISSSQYMINQGWHDPTWSIEVYAVPSSERAQAKRLIVDTGALEAAREWLMQPRATNWQHGRKKHLMTYHPQLAQLSWHDYHDEY